MYNIIELGDHDGTVYKGVPFERKFYIDVPLDKEMHSPEKTRIQIPRSLAGYINHLQQVERDYLDLRDKVNEANSYVGHKL